MLSTEEAKYKNKIHKFNMEGIYAYQRYDNESTLEDSTIVEEPVSLEQSIIEHQTALDTIRSVVERMHAMENSDSLETAINLQAYLERQMEDIKLRQNRCQTQSSEIYSTKCESVTPKQTDTGILNLSSSSSSNAEAEATSQKSIASLQLKRKRELNQRTQEQENHKLDKHNFQCNGNSPVQEVKRQKMYRKFGVINKRSSLELAR